MSFPASWQDQPPPQSTGPEPVLDPPRGNIGTQWTDMDGVGPAGGAPGGGAGGASVINNVIISFNGTLYYCQLLGTIGAPV